MKIRCVVVLTCVCTSQNNNGRKFCFLVYHEQWYWYPSQEGILLLLKDFLMYNPHVKKYFED